MPAIEEELWDTGGLFYVSDLSAPHPILEGPLVTIASSIILASSSPESFPHLPFLAQTESVMEGL